MADDSRLQFRSKENRASAISHLSSLSEADLCHLKKIITREISKRKVLKIGENRTNTINSSFGFYKAIKGLNRSVCSRMSKIDLLFSQDWSHLFKSQNEDKKYYVYFHLDPTVFSKAFSAHYGCKSGIPFYVGKGCGARAFDLNRNQGHGTAIRQILDKGYTKEEIVIIAYQDLTESQALEIESKLIYLFGSIYERGRKDAYLLNLDIPARPF